MKQKKWIRTVQKAEQKREWKLKSLCRKKGFLASFVALAKKKLLLLMG
jgi:hypothetical protein